MRDSITVGLHTLGCRVNIYESCAIAEKLRESGCIIKKDGICDYHIVNTCAVTAESERKSRQLVRRCASKGKVLVIGCASQISNAFNDIENVVYIGGNRNKMAVVDYILGEEQKCINAVSEMCGAPYEEMNLQCGDSLFSQCRAFIKIQDGCNGKCTYCIIPKCRGSVRSRNLEDIVDEAKRLSANGYSEIILTGIEVGAYNKSSLATLIECIGKVDGIRRVRLGSLSPNVINDRFLNTVSNVDSFMPHIHLSLQSCCDRILGLMKRPYRKIDIYERVSAIKKAIPNCMISADIIVGFPGETDEEFLETKNALCELGIFHVHSFPYSERSGTPAAEMSDIVPKSVRNQRNVDLIAACAELRKAFYKTMVGGTCSVLVEKVNDNFAVGHTENFIEVAVDSKEIRVGDIINVIIESYDDSVLYGRVVQEDKNA